MRARKESMNYWARRFNMQTETHGLSWRRWRILLPPICQIASADVPLRPRLAWICSILHFVCFHRITCTKFVGDLANLLREAWSDARSQDALAAKFPKLKFRSAWELWQPGGEEMKCFCEAKKVIFFTSSLPEAPS